MDKENSSSSLIERELTPPVPTNESTTNPTLKWFYRDVYTFVLPDFIRELRHAMKGCETVLDVGCGVRSPLKHFNKQFKHSVGVDLHKPSIEISKKSKIHSEYVHSHILDIDKHFEPESFDCVVSFDVIEHLKKEDGFKLMEKMEKLSKKRTIIFTPTGFLPQGVYDENPCQVHLSGWEVKEMQKHGYKVIGINGWKPLRGEYAELKYKPKMFWWVLSDLTQPIVRHFPEHAFQILCIKDKK